jgi:hypothetical protein
VVPGSQGESDDGFLRVTTAAGSGASVRLTLFDDPSGFDLSTLGTTVNVYVEAAPATPDMFMQFTATDGRTSQRAVNYRGAGTYQWTVPFRGEEISLVTWRGGVSGASELRVGAITIVPEPASLAVPLGVILMLRRRRRA